MENRVSVVDFLEQVIMLEEMLAVMQKFNFDESPEVVALRERLDEFEGQRQIFLAALTPEVSELLNSEGPTIDSRMGFAQALATTLSELLDIMEQDMEAIVTEGVYYE